MSKQDSRERVARNFVERYGAAGLERMLDALSDGVSGQAIAEEFGVSRERVRQWKEAFGRSVTLYQVYPEVRRLLKTD
jgi:DNA-directed RNA polymerase sigma subunit (sigma70/sigma32)